MKFTELELPFDEAENYLSRSNKSKLTEFFYQGEYFEKVKADTTYYIIGEKGSGKTAYSVYFCNNTVERIRSKRYVISVDEYSKIIRMKCEGKLNYTHYVTLWKAVILIKLFASIEKNEVSSWGSNSYKKIKDLLSENQFTNFTQESFSPIYYMDNECFTVEQHVDLNIKPLASGVKGSAAYTNKESLNQQVYFDNWTRFINNITNDIISLRLNNHHYLFIDGIDSRPSDILYEEYKECVYPLIRAVYDVNTEILSRIKERNKGRLQVVLLSRPDVFLRAGLSNPGSKINDNAVFLNWGFFKEEQYKSSSIYALINSVLKTGGSPSECIGWDSFFNYSPNSFVSILRNTTAKPRDFIKMFKIIQLQCKAEGNDTPSKAIVESDYVKRAYSTYFVDILRTALSFYYNENDIDNIFGFIRSIRRLKFTLSQFKEKYKKSPYLEALSVIFKNENELLKLLFDFNMICIVEKGPYYRWKYRELTIANYNYSLSVETLSLSTCFRFHPALEKEFALYLQ